MIKCYTLHDILYLLYFYLIKLRKKKISYAEFVYHCFSITYFVVNPIQDGLFQGCPRMEGAKKVPLPKICHTYPAMMKLGTVIPYLKKIQKIYEARDTYTP